MQIIPTSYIYNLGLVCKLVNIDHLNISMTNISIGYNKKITSIDNIKMR